MKKVIGQRIREIRRSKDYSQENMASELHITAGAYAKIERGETDPSATRLVRIAEILEVDVAIFFRQPDAAQKAGPITGKTELNALTILVQQLHVEIENLKDTVASLQPKGS